MSCVLRRTLVKKTAPMMLVWQNGVQTLMDSNQNVTTDNFFTSIKTTKKLLEHDITMLGALRSNKKEIPRKLLYDARKLLIHSCKFLFGRDDGIMIAFYKAKQKRNVLLLAFMNTRHHWMRQMPKKGQK